MIELIVIVILIVFIPEPAVVGDIVVVCPQFCETQADRGAREIKQSSVEKF